MSRLIKCQGCLEFESDREKLIKNDKGKYFHKEKCYEEHLEHRKFLENEKEDWDELYQYIKELHGLLVVPTSNITRLQALRNGEDVKQGKKYKRYKMGAEYSLMLEAYLLAESDIKWCISNKLDNKNDVSAINYCISIMVNKLNEAWKNRQKKKTAKIENKKLEKQINEMSDVAQRVREIQSTISQKDQIDDIDITTLLD